MTKTADAIIIGTGVIGAAIGLRTGEKGCRKRLCSSTATRQVGHGSTAGSCAIIRMHYSTRSTAPRLPGRDTITGATGQEYLGVVIAGTPLAQLSSRVGCIDDENGGERIS